MKISLEDIHDFLGSWTASLIFLSLLLMFVGAFLLTQYENGVEVTCLEVKVVIQEDTRIEDQLIDQGKIKEALRLHTSLEHLIKKADTCDADFLRKLLNKKSLKNDASF